MARLKPDKFRPRKGYVHDIGRRKEKGKFYKVYIVHPADKNDMVKAARKGWKNVMVKGSADEHYALWVNGKK